MDCPVGCAEPLGQIIDQLGCCYRPLYGNSDVEKRYPALYNDLSANVRGIFEILLAGPIFGACNLSYNEPCAGNGLTNATNVGVCTFDQVATRVFNPLIVDSDCTTANTVVIGLFPGNLTASAARLCEDDCSPVIAERYEEECLSSIATVIQNTNCLPSEGASLSPYCNFVGRPDFVSILTDTFLSIEIDCRLNTPNPPTECTEECRARFTALVDHVGCCYQSFYNNSLNLDLLYTSGNIGSQDKVLLEQIRNPVYWEQCDIDIITACGESSAARFVASFVVLVVAAIVATILF